VSARREPWTAQYLKIPFLDRGAARDGADCWGFFRLILAEQCGIVLPDYSDVPAGDWRAKVKQITAGAGEAADWEPIAAGTEQPFDAVLMRGQFRHDGRARSAPVHIGAVVTPGALIHIEDGAGVTVVDYRRHMLVKNRVIAFYRYRGAAE
jgi:cell wall-associated NlpC family hydrolase